MSEEAAAGAALAETIRMANEDGQKITKATPNMAKAMLRSGRHPAWRAKKFCQLVADEANKILGVR